MWSARSTTSPPRSRCCRVRREADRAADAGATDTAVAVGILGQVLLVVWLRVIELLERLHLGGDLAVSGFFQLVLKHLQRVLDRGVVFLRRVIDRASVLRAGVVALAHALRRVVVLPEHLQQLVVADLGR